MAAKHGLTVGKEKTIIIAILGVLVLVVLVWFSQDFPAQGQAYSLGLEVEQAKNINRDLLTYCDSPGSCAFVNEVIDEFSTTNFLLNGKEVSAYELTYYGKKGVQITLPIDWVIEGSFDQTMNELGVKTIGYQGSRYPVSRIAVEKLSTGPVS